MAITSKDVATLREMTGAGMMDCKKALTQADGDMDKAVEFLREKGLAAAAKKAGRIAAEGIVYAYVCENSGVGVVLEVNAETDFVSKNEDFVKFVKDIAEVVSKQAPVDMEDLGNKKYPGSEMTVEEMRKEKVLVIGENIQIRRFERYEGGKSVSYIHMGGRIGVLVNMEVSDNLKDSAEVEEIGKDVCMQIAAMRPQYLGRDNVPEEVVAKEKEFQLHQTMNEGKPAAVAEKIVAGRINKFFEEICLVDQTFVKDNKQTVGKYVEQRAKELGGSIKLAKFARFEKGEGLQKREDNFAEEVAKAVKG